MLRVNPGLYLSQADDLLTSSILSKVPEIRIFPNTGPDIVESLLQVVSEGKAPKLKKITVSLATASLSQLSPEILAGAAVKLERFSAGLSSVQNEAILTRSATTQDSRLRELSCYHMAEMPGMDPEILSQALVKLEIVGYRGFLVKLSPDQVLALFSRIRESPDLRLTELEIYLDVSGNLRNISFSPLSCQCSVPAQSCLCSSETDIILTFQILKLSYHLKFS